VGVLDVPLKLSRHFFGCGLDGGGIENHLAFELVEVFGVFQRGRVAALLDGVEHGANLFIDRVLVAGGGVRGFLQIGDGHGPFLVEAARSVRSVDDRELSVSACILRCKRLHIHPENS